MKKELTEKIDQYSEKIAALRAAMADRTRTPSSRDAAARAYSEIKSELWAWLESLGRGGKLEALHMLSASLNRRGIPTV